MGVWKRRGRRALVVIGAFILLGGGSMYFLSRDIEPPDLSEFKVERPPVAEEENAFTHFTRAFRLLVPEGPDAEDGEGEDDGDSALEAAKEMYAVDHLSMAGGEPTRVVSAEAAREHVRGYLARHEDVLPHLRAGLSFPVCLTPELEDLSGRGLPEVMEWMKLGMYLQIRTEFHRREGDFTTATDSLLLLLGFAQHLLQEPSCIITFLIPHQIQAGAMEQVQAFLDDPATPDATLDALADALERSPSITEPMRKAVQGEFLLLVATFRRCHPHNLSDLLFFGADGGLAGFLSSHFPRYVFQPHRTAESMIGFNKRILADAERPFSAIDAEFYRSIDYPDQDAPGFPDILLPNSFGRFIAHGIQFPVVNQLLRSYETNAELAGTRLLVALHRYRRANGALPERLDDLVPAFLPAVPVDPFDGAPFRYDRGRGLVYSVGEDGIDKVEDVATRISDGLMESVAGGVGIAFWVDAPPDRCADGGGCGCCADEAEE